MNPAVYDILGHGMMMGDRERLDGHVEALRRAIRPGAVVADIGSGTGIFAIAACRAGARRVYAIEFDPIVNLARELAEANGLVDRIEFIEALSTDVTLPEPVDVVVFDVRGILPEDQILVAKDARRFLAPGGVFIPARDVVWAAPVCAPAWYDRAVSSKLGEEGDLNLDPIRRTLTSYWYKCYVRPDQLLGPPQMTADIDYLHDDGAAITARRSWTIAAETVCHGVAVWFDAHLAPGIVVSNRPERGRDALYGQALFPWINPVELRPGDRLEITMTGTPGPPFIWQWSTAIFDDRSASPRTSFDQPAAARVMSNHAQAALTGQRTDLEIELDVLELMASRQTVGDIAARIAIQHPHRFSDLRDALTYVGRLSCLYG